MSGSWSASCCRSAFVLFAAIIAAVLTACSGGGGGSTRPNPATLTSISVTPGTPSVAAGLTQQFKAMGNYSDGSSSDLTNAVGWSSGSTGVVTINAAGLATSKAQGTATITATSGAVSGSATLTVTPAVLASISVTAATVQLGATTQMKATGTYSDQSTQDLSGRVTWNAANGYVASIDASGVVTPVSAGYSVVTATDGNVAGTGGVAVLATPRYLYESSGSASMVTRMGVNAGSGQPEFMGLTWSGISNSSGFPCLTIDPSGKHAYLVTQTATSGGSGRAGAVSVLTIDPARGTLMRPLGSPFAVSFALGCLKFAPSGKFAYAINGVEEAPNALAIFTVNGDASLTLTNTISYTDAPLSLAVDPLGQYLYVAAIVPPGYTNAASSLYGYSIDGTSGGLTALNGSPWSLPVGTSGELTVHPSGNFLYVSDASSKAISVYPLDRSSGVPNMNSAATYTDSCSGPGAVQFSPDGAHAYTISCSSGSSSEVHTYSVGSGGQMTLIGKTAADVFPTELIADPSGQFLYVLGGSSNGSTYVENAVTAFKVNADGTVALAYRVAGHQQADSIALASGPTPLTWTPTAAFITTAGDNAVTSYIVQPDGTLTAGSSLTTASGPFSASMLFWGSDLLFATQSAAPNFYGYTASSSTITNGSSFGSTASAGGIVISPNGNPTGQTAYATDPGSGSVYQFVESSVIGPWSGFTMPFYTAQNGAGPITMDPSGRYLVTANQTAKSLSLIEPLGAAPTPAVPLSFTPLTVTFDPTGNLIFVAGDDGLLHMFSSNGLGTLTDVSDGTLAGTNTASVAVDPTSRFVYAAGPAGLNAFAIHATAGTLTPIALNLGISLQSATGVYIEPSGKYLYVSVSSGTTNALYLFTIDADGTLTASSANPVATPNHATSMVFQAIVQ